MNFVPRDYQTEAHDAIFKEWESVTSTLVVAPTGCGKTVLFAMVIDSVQPKRAMIIAQRKELIWQAREKIHHVTGLECGIEMAELFVNNSLFGNPPVVISTIQTQNSNHGDRKRMGRFKPEEFGVLIVDECFPAGTRVDGRPIESFKAGETVIAFDPATHQFGPRRILRTFKHRPRSNYLCQISAGTKIITCTMNHKIWTKDGWKKASLLTGFDMVLCTNWEQRTQNSSRSGRPEPLRGNGETERQAQDFQSHWAWVDSVEIQKQTGDGTFGGMCPDGYVYNLEVERVHSYIANGVVVSNCHHGTADSYRSLINYYKTNNPEIKILGVTATPDRADEEALGQIFDTVAFDYEILDAIHDGWLLNVDQWMIPTTIDWSHIRTTAGDLNGADLAAVMESEEAVQCIVQPTLEVLFGLGQHTLKTVDPLQWGEYIEANATCKKITLCFTSSVKHAEILSNILNRVRAGMSEWVCDKTSNDVREDINSRFKSGMLQVVCNCGIYCLDSQTEILTTDGWVNMEAMSYEHMIANWDNGQVFFDKPKFIIRRDRLPNERMVVLETKNRSIRVTEDHRMIYRTVPRSDWKMAHASELVGKIAALPISGMADPLSVEIPTPRRSKRLRCIRVAANAHMLRKNNGFEWEESIAEANRRIDRRDSLEYKHPAALSLEECEFIGFWLGDGSVAHLKSGGMEYTLCQFENCSEIVARVDDLIAACGFDSVRRVKPSLGSFADKPNKESKVVVWSLPRGTGFGSQKRCGVFALEPYLQKHGSDLLWGLNGRQFDALLNGYWMADGDHGNNMRPPTPLIRICGARPQLFSLLQAIACVRGYRTSLIKRPNGKHWLWFLSFTKREAHMMTKYRLRIEEGWSPERVWCVTSTSGNIIVRRRGTVTVVGNSEGYDNPLVEVVVNARPTKSRSLYAQILGRAMRPLAGVVDGQTTADDRKACIAASGKPSMIALDFVGNSGRHKLMTSADILGGKVSDEACDRAVKIATEKGCAVRMAGLLDEQEEKLIKEAAERRRLEEARKARLIARSSYTSRMVNPFDIFQMTPVKERGWDNGKSLSQKQKALLLKQGINPEVMPYAQSKQVLNEMFRRWGNKLATLGQLKVLRRYGYTDANMTSATARTLLDKLSSNGWKRPLAPIQSAETEIAPF